ncbi:hypothetical protein [uncultured Paraglaciecola sp.]|mgnify:CR=1 FL=1|uniref:hypothetical protein n=1 Tax=uncultured Paraglaciecola sp. TaxID=1765024 RepID=UPI00262E5AF6|nr:hypothetical protein [uncultured Paraglaciecola sp.]
MFTHTAIIISFMFFVGNPVPSIETIAVPVKGSFCDSTIETITDSLQVAAIEADVEVKFVTSCPQVANPTIQSTPRVGQTNIGDRNQFPK